MNANQIINMVIRMVLNRVLRSGMNAGMNAVGNRMNKGKGPDDASQSVDAAESNKRT